MTANGHAWNAERGQRLGVTDRTMLTVDRVLRRLGGTGFETQTFVWLAGRADAARLRRSLARLAEQLPLVTARLVERGTAARWHPRRGAACGLTETELASPAPQVVLDHAAGLLARSPDPAEGDPVRFHLLHRPGPGDVFLMQYNHALVDHNGSSALLRAVEQSEDAAEGTPTQTKDRVGQYRRRFPRPERRQAMAAARRAWGEALRGGVLNLARPAGAQPGPEGVRIARRGVPAEEVRAVRGRAGQKGLPSLSMALLASVFRVLDRLAPMAPSGRRRLSAGIGVDLGLRRPGEAILGNLVSVIPVTALAADLRDRDAVVRALVGQMRQRLADGTDLGTLELITLLGRRPVEETAWVYQSGLCHGFSLWYAFFGSAEAVGTHFAGAAVEDVCFAGPCWPAIGLTLLANLYAGRLILQATYMPGSVPEPMAEAFLDDLTTDLTSGTSPTRTG